MFESTIDQNDLTTTLVAVGRRIVFCLLLLVVLFRFDGLLCGVVDIVALGFPVMLPRRLSSV